MDINALNIVNRAETGDEVTVTLPNGGETDIVLIVAGRTSRRFIQANLDYQRRTAKGRKKELTDKDVADIEREKEADDAYAAALVVGWKGMTENGKPLECTPANVQRLMAMAPYIKAQVMVASLDDARFLPKPTTASSASPAGSSD